MASSFSLSLYKVSTKRSCAGLGKSIAGAFTMVGSSLGALAPEGARGPRVKVSNSRTPVFVTRLRAVSNEVFPNDDQYAPAPTQRLSAALLKPFSSELR